MYALKPQKVVNVTVQIRTILWTVALFTIILTGCAGDNDPTPAPLVATPETGAVESSPTIVATEDSTPTSEVMAGETPEPETDPTAEATAEAQATEPPPSEETADLETLEIELQEAASGLNQPLKIVSAYDGSNRLFIVEKGGTIRTLLNGEFTPEPFLDITERVGSQGSEQGLLGLAFHPDFPEANVVFINYTDTGGNTIVSRFTVEGDAAIADPGSEEVLLAVEQPAANHNGGHLLFGPDGYLYIGLGDGGGSGDQFGNAQNGATLLGAMLRIDVDSGDPYGIPEDNPFLDNADVRDEIWATGLRNPWRYDFDRSTGDLYIADVGQNRIEEVNVQPGDSQGGENYGWPVMEGSECYQADECDQTGLVLPVTEYTHDDGCSVTGGNVYRGETYPQMAGIYLFSDFCSGNIWGLTQTAGEWQTRLLAEPGFSVSSFGEDEAGELYLVDLTSGVLYAIVAN